MFRNIIKFGIALMLLPLAISVVTYANSDNSATFSIRALDTLVGVGTYLEATPVNAEVLFQVVKPDNEIVKIPSGKPYLNSVKVELPKEYIDIAGNYRVFGRYLGVNSRVFSTTFAVSQGRVSPSKSVVSPSSQVVKASNDEGLIKVKLVDDFGNPIPGHVVKLISESANDEISSGAEHTDDNGEMDFIVSSPVKGVNTYTAFDLTSDQILNSRAKVVFFDSDEYVFSNPVPKDFLFGAMGNASGEIKSFKITDVQSSIAVGSPISFTLSAVDNNDQTVVDYLGTIRFSVAAGSSSFVNLPADYTFVPEDLGKHTFSLALSFQQNGIYKIEARDLNNLPVFGDYSFEVGSALQENVAASSISLLSPTSGKTSSASQFIGGTAPPGSAIRIFDNDVKLFDTKASLDGKFSYTTPSLTDGDHVITASLIGADGSVVTTTPKVTINIDTAAPSANKVELRPASVGAGGVVEVRLHTEEDLSKAVVSLHGNVYEMIDENLGYFKATLAAPIEFGQYPLNFVLSDQLGNETKFEHTEKLKVGPDLSPKAVSLLGNVSNLLVKSSDHRLTLNWSPPASIQSPIANYRVYYGLSPNQLSEVVDTFTPATTWYLPNLKNGVEYFVAVVAIDVNGKTSQNFSNIVSAIPGAEVVNTFIQPEVYNGTAGAEAIEEMPSDPSEAGPEIVWLIFLSLLAGYLYTRYKKLRLAYEVD